jgi:hypothetical protein
MSDSEDQEYEVEGIVKDRLRGGRPLYFVKWKGFPPSENTWEPADHLNAELIADYLARKGEGKHQRAQAANPQPPAPEEAEIVEVTALKVADDGILATVRMSDGLARVVPVGEVRQSNPGALFAMIGRLAQ